MRVAATCLVLCLASALAVSLSTARAEQGPRGQGAGLDRGYVAKPVDDHDDSRVGVQLVVAGIAAGVVVGVGTAAYLVRRKLGRTAYSPDDAGGSGHH